MVPLSRTLDRALVGGLIGVALVAIPIDDAEARRFRIGGGIRSVTAAGKAVTKSYTGNHLAPDQLKTCLASERKLEKVSNDLDHRSQAISNSQEAIRKEKLLVEIAQASVDRYSQRSVDQFNAMVDKFNARISANKREIADYNRDVESQKSQAAGFNADCGGKLYYEDDLALALTQLGVD